MPAAVSFYWEPDPRLLAASMDAVAMALEDQTAPLVAASEQLQADIAERFHTETAPDGTPWEPWSEAYTPVAESYPNEGILRQSGALYDVATSSETVTIRGDTVFYRTNHLPSYGLAHQFGDPGRKDPLPARPFLGMSAESETFIFAAFSEWFDRSIDLWVTPSGRIGKRHALQGPGGFVSRASAGLGPMSSRSMGGPRSAGSLRRSAMKSVG
jgi:phage gpG-like protein